MKKIIMFLVAGLFLLSFVSAEKSVINCYEWEGLTYCKKEMVGFSTDSDFNNGGIINSHFKLIAKHWVYDEEGKLIPELSTADLDNGNRHENREKGNFVQTDFWGFLKYEKCWVKEIIIKGNYIIRYNSCYPYP